MEVKDFSVTKELFNVWECADCTLRFTQHAPTPENIGRYYASDAYVSHSDTRKGLINNLYHSVKKFTIAKKVKLIKKVSGLAKGNLLDVGAGTGSFANAMQQAGWQVTGLEPDETARANALKNHNLNLQNPDTLYSLPPATFDAITMWHVLEHVHDLHGYFAAYKRILKSTGTLIIAVPNYTSTDAQFYNEFWAAYDVPRHLYHFSPESMRQLTKQYNFTIAAYKPMPFDSFYVSMLSEQYKNGKQNLFTAFKNGLSSNIKASRKPQLCSSVIYVIKHL